MYAQERLSFSLAAAKPEICLFMEKEIGVSVAQISSWSWFYSVRCWGHFKGDISCGSWTERLAPPCSADSKYKQHVYSCGLDWVWCWTGGDGQSEGTSVLLLSLYETSWVGHATPVASAAVTYGVQCFSKTREEIKVTTSYSISR